jgi:hypothetical protein
VFLTDESGVKSKIGVTTCVDGYVTAHYKNDSLCSKDELSNILRRRGTSFDILLPSKEVVSKISNWNNFSVSSLKEIGFTNIEILKKKTSYNTNNTKGDLSHFTKEEIDKYNLLEKTSLYPSDLKSFSKDEVVKNNNTNVEEVKTLSTWRFVNIVGISLIIATVSSILLKSLLTEDK